MNRLLGFFLAGLLSFSTAFTESGTWLLNPSDGNWNTAINWSCNCVPTDTAIFDVFTTGSVFLSTNTRTDDIVFNAGASAFTITASPMPTATATISP